MGLYSVFDRKMPDEFIFIPRNEDKLGVFENDKSLIKLIRFTKGFYHIGEDKNGLYFVDLRFGKAGMDEDADFVFKFYLNDIDGQLVIKQSTESRKMEAEAFYAFINRIRGNKQENIIIE